MVAMMFSFFRSEGQLVCFLAVHFAGNAFAEDARPVIAVIGTGDMGDSLGVRLAGLGYNVVYGSRNPSGEKAQGV